MTRTVTRFILVDDDPIHLKLSTFQIGSLNKDITTCTFLQAEKALHYIRSTYQEDPGIDGTSIIMVNVNMVGLSGWDFLEAYETLDKKYRDQMELYFVSASIDPEDKKRARSNPHVIDYLVKPLSRSDFRNLIMKNQIK